MDARAIKKRLEARMSERTNIEGIWNLVERFIVPFRAMLFSDKNGEGAVDWKRREIFDSTAIQANSNLAAHIHGALTNPALKWFSMAYKDKSVQKEHDAKIWLEEADEINYTSIKESNFDLEANEVYLDLTSFGGGSISSMPVEDQYGDLEETDYKAMPVDECYFDFDVKGNIINFYRMLNWSADQWVDKFGLENIPETVFRDFASDDRSGNRHKLIFCIYKRPDKIFANTFTLLDKKNRPYGSKYVHWETCEQIGEEGGHYEMPVMAPRWRRVSGSTWGFSPAMIAIWDVLVLNQLKQLLLMSGEKVLDPTILTTKKGVFGDIDLSSGGTVVVQDIEKSMKVFESKARFDVSQLNKAELISAIKEIFYMNELQLKESPAMTATEVHARIQLLQKLLGPTTGRLTKHFLDPIVTRQFMINYRYKKFPPMPDILRQRAAELKIEYLGSLVKSQKMDQSRSIQRWVGTAVNMAEVFPQVLDLPDPEAILREIAEDENVPSRLLKSQRKIEQARRIKQKAMAEREAIAKQTATGEAMTKMGEGRKALKEAESNAA